MRFNRFSLALAAAALLSVTTFNANSAEAPPVALREEPSFTSQMFPAGISADFYATATFADLQSVSKESAQIGGGIGINAFVSRHFGIGAELNSLTPQEGTFLDEVNVKAIVRLPIAIISPSLFAGPGYNLESKSISVFGGAGLEVKVWRNSSVFADARYVYVPDEEAGYPMGRLGMRFNF